MSEQRGQPLHDSKGSRHGDQTKPTTLSTEADIESGTTRAPRPEPPKRPEALHPAASVGIDERSLKEVVVEFDSDRDSGSPDQHVVVVTEPISVYSHGRSRPPSRQSSVTPSRPSRQVSLLPPRAGSSHQLQAPSLGPNARNDPQQCQVSDDPTMTEYPSASPPAWYVRPVPDDSTAYRATSHTMQQPQGHYYPSIRDVTLASSHEPRLSIAEQVTSFDKKSLYPPNPPSHTRRSLSKAPQRSWIGAVTYQPRTSGKPSGALPEQYTERPVSRRDQQRPISPTGSAYGTSTIPLVSRGTQSVIKEGSNVQRPHLKQYRRQTPSSDSERSLHSGMGPSIDRQPQAHTMPSRHARDQPPPSRRGTISRGNSSAISSKRLLAMVVPQNDSLAGDGSRSSSSRSSAALEGYDAESVPKARELPLPGTVETLTPESGKETTSQSPPPSIYVVPAYTPSPPPSGLGGTQGRPPTSMVDSQPTLGSSKIYQSASSRSAQKQVYPEEIQQSTSRRSEDSRRRFNEPPQVRQISRASGDPDRREPERIPGRLDVPGRPAALPGLSRIGSSGSLSEQAQAAELRFGGEASQSTSGYFTESESDRTSNYSDDSDGSLDEGTESHSRNPRTRRPQHAIGDPRSNQPRPVEDERPPAAGYPTSSPDPRLDNKISKPFPGPPPQQHPVDSVATENESEKRGRQSRSRMPGGFPGGA